MHMYACMKFVFFFIFKSRLTKDVLVDLLCRLIYYTSLRRHHVVEYHVFHLNMSKRQCQHYCFVFFVFVFPSIDHCHVSMLVPCSPWCRRTSLRTEKSCKMEHNRAVQQMQLSDYCCSVFFIFYFLDTILCKCIRVIWNQTFYHIFLNTLWSFFVFVFNVTEKACMILVNFDIGNSSFQQLIFTFF